MSLITKLKELRSKVNSEGFSTDVGICGQLILTDKELTKLNKAFTKWPKFSGELSYPIPLSRTTPKIAYIKYSVNCWNMWDKTEEYGKLRHELLDFCISHLKQTNT